MKHVADESCTENQNTHFVSITFFFENRHVCVLKRRNITQPDSPQADNVLTPFETSLAASLIYCGLVSDVI
jgi:hypothetical protein